MAKQRFLNNFTSTFIAAVKDAPSSGTPETELDYGVLRISDGAAGSLINPTDGDYYLLTAFKRSGSVESNIEVMRVTAVDNSTPGECRITVQRAQEGTSAKAFVAGDYLSLRITKGTAENFSQPADLATKEPVIAAPVSAPTEKYWRGDKTWRDFFTDVRAATLTGLSTATNAVVAAADTVLAAIGKLQKQVSDNLATLTSHTGNTSNPHGVTKVQVGLGDVDNTSDANKPVSTATQTALNGTVKTTGDQMVGGNKTFSGYLTLSAPRLYQSANSISFELGPGVGTGDPNIQGFYVGSGKTLWFGSNAGGGYMILDGSGNFTASGNILATRGVLGYGPGAGGTVTQATSKSTGVTLNKPSGRITMHNAALAAGAFVVFNFTNATIAFGDEVSITMIGGNNYRVETIDIWDGACALRVTNISASSLSDALAFNFKVFKGVWS